MASILSSASSSGTGLTLTFGFTTPVGTDLLVIIVNSAHSTSATFNGTNVTNREQGFGKTFADNWVTISMLESPPIGGYNVVIDATPNSGLIHATAFAVQGADIVNGIFDAQKNTAPGGSNNGDTDTTLTTQYDNSIIFTGCVQHSTTTSNPAMGIKYGATSVLDANPFAYYKYGASYQITGASGSQSIGWDNVTGRDAGGDKCTLCTYAVRTVPTKGGAFLLNMIHNRRIN